MKLKLRLAAALLVALSWARIVDAQTTVTTTTLTTAVQTGSTAIRVASAAGFLVNYYVYIDNELMRVTSVQSTTVGVARPQSGTYKDAHILGATVYVAPKNAFYTSDPSYSQCDAASEQYNVRINIYNGVVWSCSAGTWVTIARVGGNGVTSGGAGSGSVTSVGATVPSILTVSDVPITTSGTIAVDTATQAANTVFAGPTSGPAAQPTFRSLVNADITSLAWSKVTATPTTFAGYGIVDTFANFLTAATATRQGNTAKLVTFAGSASATNDCAKFDVNGNIATTGSACGAGGGGDVFSNTATSATGELAEYADTGGKLIGRSFFALAGPATTIKTFTFPNASASVLTTAAAVTVAQGGTGLTAGSSGGVPYYSGSTTLASSAALTANVPVLGGGAGAAPTVGTRSGNTTTFATTSGSLTSGNCVKSDSSGNLVDNGAVCGSGGGNVSYLTKIANYTLLQTDDAVEGLTNAFTLTLPTAAGISGHSFFIKNLQTANTVTVATVLGQTIDGSASTGVVNGCIQVKSDGSNYRVVGACGFPIASLTADGVFYAASTTTIGITGAGTAGQTLTSNGAGVAPTFQTHAPDPLVLELLAQVRELTAEVAALKAVLANVR